MMYESISGGLRIAYLVLPIMAAICLIAKKSISFWNWGKWMLIVSLLCYLLLLVSVRFTSLRLKANLDSHDLDGNEMFSGSELTPQMYKAMKEWTSDTGRTLAPITGLFISPIYCGFWFVIIGLPYILVKRNGAKRAGADSDV
ncbi:MAG: hypothetical protein ACRDBP_11085 [Luteolibacter sp.]